MTVKLAIVTSKVSRLGGGLFYSVRALAQGMVSRDVMLTVFGERDNFTNQDALFWKPVKLLLYTGYLNRFLGLNIFVFFRIMGGGFNIIHVHNMWRFPSVIGAFGNIMGKIVIVSPRGALDPWALKQSSWKKRLAWYLYEKRNLSKASCIHALSQKELLCFRNLGFRNPIAVIPNGVYPKTGVDGCCVRKKNLLFIGRIHRKKGIFELLEAWSILEASGMLCGWRLIIAGWGTNSDIADLEKKVGKCCTVKYVGPAYGSFKQDLLDECGAFILPSYSEGLPMAVLEAWSNTIPALITSNCNLEIGFKQNAAYKISTEPTLLAEELKSFFDKTQDEISSYGYNGKRLVEDEFTWEVINNKFYCLYRWLDRTGPKPDFVDELFVDGF